MVHDRWAGDGIFLETEVSSHLPECRNDLEFGFVSGMCGYRRISLQHNVDLMGNTLDEDGNRVDSMW